MAHPCQNQTRKGRPPKSFLGCATRQQHFSQHKNPVLLKLAFQGITGRLLVAPPALGRPETPFLSW